MMSETPRGLLHASLIARPDATADPSQQVARVRMLRDATGQTSHPGPPRIISAKEGAILEVSGDLALLWFASKTAEPWKDEPVAEPTVEPAPPAPQEVEKIAPEAQAIRTATQAASVKAAETLESARTATAKKRATRGKGKGKSKAGDRFARKDPWSEEGS